MALLGSCIVCRYVYRGQQAGGDRSILIVVNYEAEQCNIRNRGYAMSGLQAGIVMEGMTKPAESEKKAF